ncbi:uncharacterized protein VSU04_013200 isoform 5-T6 [Chlamydotis macqueenii]
MWNLKHGGGQPSGRSYRRGEKQKAASDLSDSPSSAGSESCASEAPRAAVAASDFLGMSGADGDEELGEHSAILVSVGLFF